MISIFQSMLHLTAAAALSAGMIGAGVGAIGRAAGRRATVRPLWLVGGLGGAAMTFAVAQMELQSFSRALPSTGVLGGSIGLLLVIACGVAFLVVGLRGRRVGDHEHCRRCGFDLFGRPEGTRVCGECGTPLDAKRAIVVGVRHRRPVPLLAGAFAVVLCVAIGGVVARDALTRPGGFDWIRYKPTSWLIDDIVAAQGALRANAPAMASLNEFDRRARAGELSAADGRRLVAEATTPAARGGSLFDGYVLDAWSRKVIDDATMRQYVLARVRPTASLHRTSRPTLVRYEIQFSDLPTAMGRGGGGAGPAILWTVAVKDRADTLNGAPVLPSEIVDAADGETPLPPVTFGSVRPNARALPPTPFGRGFRPATPLPAGPVAYRIKMTAVLTLHALGGAPLVVDVPVDMTARTTVEVVDRFPSAGPPDARMEQLRARMLPAQRPANAAFGPAGDMSWGGVLRVETNRDAVGLFVGDVYARDPKSGVETLLGPIVLERGSGELRFDEPFPYDATLVFRPVPTRIDALMETVPTYQHVFEIPPARVTWR